MPPAGAEWVTAVGGCVGVSASAAAAGAAALAAGAAASGTASPSSTMMPIGWLTCTPSVPSPTRMRPRMPSSTASTSIVALSVSISAMMSPDAMASPSFFSQRASVPSVIVGDSAGIRMFTDIV